MKLIIDIPDYEYRQIKEVYEKNDIVSSTYSYIYHGILLDDVKSEIEALPKTYPFVNHIDTYVKEDDVLQILDNIGKDKGGE